MAQVTGNNRIEEVSSLWPFIPSLSLNKQMNWPWEKKRPPWHKASVPLGFFFDFPPPADWAAILRPPGDYPLLIGQSVADGERWGPRKSAARPPRWCQLPHCLPVASAVRSRLGSTVGSFAMAFAAHFVADWTEKSGRVRPAGASPISRRIPVINAESAKNGICLIVFGKSGLGTDISY